jgi:peptidoglycan DL-endopeptidase CwlO
MLTGPPDGGKPGPPRKGSQTSVSRALVGCRSVRAAARGHARSAFLAGAAIAAAVLLFGAGGARAQQGDAASLRSTDDALAAKSRGVVLELFALQSELARAQARASELHARASQVAGEQRSARLNLVRVKGTLAEAQRRLEQRLRDLYIEGEPDPLAVLLGAESFHDALSAIDNLERIANQDVEIVAGVRRARADVRRALVELDRRSASLRTLQAEADRAVARLLASQAERQGYLASLRRERHLTQTRISALTGQASAAQDKADDLQGSSGGGGGSPAPPPAPPPAGTGSGRRMTVQATGYALRGTTATGVPTGWGIVAVDPSVIPLGTRMTIPGYGEGVAADTGSAVRGYIIDLWFPSREQALQWGRRTVTITLH